MPAVLVNDNGYPMILDGKVVVDDGAGNECCCEEPCSIPPFLPEPPDSFDVALSVDDYCNYPGASSRFNEDDGLTYWAAIKFTFAISGNYNLPLTGSSSVAATYTSFFNSTATTATVFFYPSAEKLADPSGVAPALWKYGIGEENELIDDPIQDAHTDYGWILSFSYESGGTATVDIYHNASQAPGQADPGVSELFPFFLSISGNYCPNLSIAGTHASASFTPVYD